MSLLIGVDRLRRVAESKMDGSVVILRGSLTTDGVGGQTRGTVAVGTFPCRAVPRRGEPTERVQGERQTGQLDWHIYVPQGTDVQPATDRLVLQGGGTFEVIGVHAGRAYEPSRRIVCTERH